LMSTDRRGTECVVVAALVGGDVSSQAQVLQLS